MPRPHADPEEIARAAASLRAGNVIAFPTETVYGLGAALSRESAVRRIFDLKRRPLSQPLLAHVDGVEMARALAADWTARAEDLAARFWPGPLTLVMPKSGIVPDIVTGGGPTIGLRCPDHPVALELIRSVGEAVAGTSANRSGEPSPTRPEHVRRSFPADVVETLDDGPTPGGVESTVLLLGESASEDRILRPGPIGASQLELVEIDAPEATARGVGRIVLVKAHEVADAIGVASESVLITHAPSAAPPGARVIALPDEAAAYGRAMYDALHEAEAMRREPGTILVVEPTNRGDLWDAIRQRLRRLSGKK